MDLRTLNFTELRSQFEGANGRVSTAQDLEVLRRDWLGREGTIKVLFQQLRDVPPDQKPAIAQGLNELKGLVENSLLKKEEQLSSQSRQRAVEQEFFDFSLPGLTAGTGRLHPITLVERRIAELLRPFGFLNVLGPEVETEYYCFDALNIPPHHPARDMQDTFYTSTGHVLRTHTTSVQARVLEKGELPVKVASFGRVFRNENEDASHQAMFHQFELVWIEPGLTLSNLIAIITHILKGLYGKRRKVRFVPKFYPYTEPSIGPQIDCGICKGQGCKYCGGSGWVTVAGAGMVHRNVLKEFKYDHTKVSGFAFGLGTGRLAVQAAKLNDGRALYENDLRILREIV